MSVTENTHTTNRNENAHAIAHARHFHILYSYNEVRLFGMMANNKLMALNLLCMCPQKCRHRWESVKKRAKDLHCLEWLKEIGISLKILLFSFRIQRSIQVLNKLMCHLRTSTHLSPSNCSKVRLYSFRTVMDTNYHFVHPNGRKIKYWLIRLGLDTISLLVMAHALIEKNSKNMREYHGS